MQHYLVERFLPSTAVAEVEAAVARLDAGNALGARHLWTAMVVAEETCLSLFAAPSLAAVQAANRAAAFPFDRVIEAELIEG
jgi:hypothetical protein